MSRAARLHLGLARVLRWLGWSGGALAACRDAVAAKPDWAEAQLELGESLADVGDWGEAVAAFEKAIRLQPSNAEARGNLVVALTRQGRVKDAVLALEDLAHHRPHDVEVHLVLGTLYRRLHRHGDAMRSFRWAVQLPGPRTGARCWLGARVLGPAPWEEVAATYGRAAALGPGAPAGEPAPSWRSALNQHPVQAREFQSAPAAAAQHRRRLGLGRLRRRRAS
jgi:Flp pilus assembly protein TadD